MISMQRSLSSPVRIRSSPPVPPTVEDAPRAPSPTADNHEAVRTNRFRSRSPNKVTGSSQNPPLRRDQDVTRKDRQHYSPAMSSRRPVVEQPSAPSPAQGHSRHGSSARPVTPPPRPERIPSTHPKTLLPDVSLYTNTHLTRDNGNTTLEELAHIVRLSKYQERKRANTRTRLQRSLVSTALSARLTRCGEIAHRNLVDCFRRDDKDSFAALYNAIHDVRRSCDERRRYSLFEPDMQSLSSPILGSSESLLTPSESLSNSDPLGPTTPFLQDISTSARDTLLDFLAQIRTNPDYLATRICALSSSELKVFLSFHKDLEPVESVLPSHGRAGRSHASASARNSTNVDIERLLSFQRHDPLSILIHTCFANSAGPDSSEDQRRTDIWATVMARLISEFKSTGEHFIISVLNIWTTMRDWSGKSNMEWYLMKILKDGAFLLELAEDQHGTRFNLSDWNQSDELAEKRFYDKAVEELFELVDDDDATGIPEGLLELGNAILGKLDSKYVENASRWLVWRCLFFVFFLGVIIHPESYGMLVDYHITPYAREKILKKVAMKAHEYVSSMWSGKPSATDVSVEIPSAIKGHLESVLARFQGSRSKVPSAKLLPARSITSLRETVEVHPYLVLSPADLVTLVNALFPERRPMSAASYRSGSASLSSMPAMSQPIPTQNPRDKMETPSVISTSAGSIVSDATTSREGFFDDPSSFIPQRYSPPSMDPETIRRQGKYEDDGYKLRLALHELQHSLGPEVTRGSCHPCAERWMVLFVSADGKTLTTQMTYDPEDDRDEEDNSSTTDTDEDDTSAGPQMDKEYLHLRDSILKLVEDYEIPHSLEPETPTTLSNRASGLKRYKSKNKIITPEKSMLSRNPYRKQVQPDVQSSPGSPAKWEDSKPKQEDGTTEAVLMTMLKSASSQSKSQADFVSSHMYWKTLKQLHALESPSLRQNGYAALINIFSRGPKDSIRRSAAAIEEYDAWLIWLKQSQERHEGLIDGMMKRVRAVRDKMWYVTDVRNSKVYEHSRKVCQALKAMGAPRRNSFQRSKTSAPRGNNAGYLYRAESQIMDLLAANEDQGGPNKLSDDQTEKTSLWLQQRGIANLCAGEERMHRFSYEVDQCISMLVGETIREAPVLWSSELYKRDRIVYDRLRAREREQAANGDDSASMVSDSERRYGSSSGKPGSLNRDLRNISLNTSGHSFDSRHGMPRASAPLSDILDGHDYFDRTSPIYANDNMSTFWSPFQPSMSPGSGGSRAYSPTTSLTNVSTTFSGQPHHAHLPSNSSVSMGRPGTSASSTETIFQHRADDEKTRFLNELRQALTSLLLSDLGSLVLAKGSETDSWFENIGQQCIDRKDAVDKRAKYKREKREKEKEKERRNSNRPRTLEKKKSFRDLRGADTDRMSEPSEIASSPSTPSTLEPVMRTEAKDDFPFKKAYQRLLNMFCVHPDPYAKLKALNELENLILASMNSKGPKRTKWNRSDAGSSVAGESGNFRPAQLEGTIEHLRDRRTQALHSAGYGGQGRSNAETRSIMSGAGQTDAITRELQTLFRDACIRPKSLFRDLQFIATFVPGSVLDRPERGNAFWNTGLAALKLKSEVCRTMMEMADEVVAAHTQHRKATNEAVVADLPPSLTGTPPPPSTSYRLEDAGRMWTITAKEGYPTAQRELGLFYMSNPEYVERTTLPLSKPREVFKQTVMDKYGRGRGMSSAQQPGAPAIAAEMGDKDRNVRNDPGLMCVAFHWMEAAERGGDEVATNYMRQKEFMDLN